MLRIVRPNDGGQQTRPSRGKKPCFSLTPEESSRLRVVLNNLHRFYRTWDELARAMGVCREAVTRVASGRHPGSPALLLRAARVSGLPLERILSGTLTIAGRCPVCGRGDT